MSLEELREMLQDDSITRDPEKMRRLMAHVSRIVAQLEADNAALEDRLAEYDTPPTVTVRPSWAVRFGHNENGSAA